MKKVIAFALVILVVLVFAQSNVYVVHSYVEETGYAMPKNKILENLSDEKLTKADPVSLISIHEDEPIYQRGNGFYASNKKQAVDLDYPILTKKGTGARFTDSSSSLITSSFDVLPTYNGLYVSGGNTFQASGEQADLDEIILIQLKNGLFMNTEEMRIDTILESYSFPIHSIANFEETFINGYVYDAGTQSFVAIRGLQNAVVSIGNQSMTYTELLKKLGLVNKEINKQNKEEEKIVEEIKKDQEENNPKKESDKDKKEPIKKPGNKPGSGENNSESGGIEKPLPPDEGDNEDGGDPQDPPIPGYTKPKVTCGEFTPWVYTVHTDLKVEDPSSKIIRNLRFNVYDASGKLVMRKQYRSSTTAVLSILPPDSDLYIQGTFQYYDQHNNKVDETFLETTKVSTMKMKDNLSDINVDYEESLPLLPNKLKIKQLHLENNSDYDKEDTSLENFYKNTLPYINRVSFVFVDQQTNEELTSNLNADTIKKLMDQQTLDVESGAILKSNTSYNYRIELYDRFGNLLPTNPDIVQSQIHTAKKTPTLKTQIVENKPSNFKVSLQLNDIDQAIQGGSYTFKILDEQGQPLLLTYESDQGESGKGEKDIKIATDTDTTILNIKNLPYAQKLTMVSSAEYDLNDTTGIKSSDINSTVFYSAFLPSGSIQYTTSFDDISGTSATINMELNKKSTIVLADLMSEFTINIKGGSTSQKILIDKNTINNIDIDKNYDEETGTLLIQEEDTLNKIPRITMSVTKELLHEEGMTPWQALINGSYYGTQNGLAGVLHIYLSENSLQPSTEYKMSLECYSKQDSYIYDLKYTLSKDSFTTKKQEPQVIFDDMFLGQDFLEFYQLTVKDTDETIIDKDYSIQLLKDGKVIDTKYSKVDEINETLRFSSLLEHQEYEIRFITGKYNDGQTTDTLKYNYIFKSFKFNTKDGLQANIELNDMNYVYDEVNLSGNLDKSTIKYNTGINTNTSVIEDKPGYFITDYIPFDITKLTLLQNFGGGTLRIKVYNQNKAIVGTTTYDSNFHLYSLDYSAMTNWAFIQIEGIMGYEDKANITVTERSQDNVLKSTKIFPNTTLSDGKETFSPTQCVSDYIKVTPGQYYYASGGAYVVNSFDKDKNYLSTSSVRKFNWISSETAYIRITITSGATLPDNEVFYFMDDLKPKEGKQVTLHNELIDTQGILSKSDEYQITRYETSNLKKQDYQKTKEDSYSFTETNGLVDNVDEYKTMQLDGNKAYKFELSIKYHGRTILLDQCEFTTDKKVYTLNTPFDLMGIRNDTTGTYYAMNDITETPTEYIYQVGQFLGTIDFQGHTLTLDSSITSNRITTLYYSGVVKNIRIKGTLQYSSYFLNGNYGKLDNLVYAPDTIDKKASPLIATNAATGVVENFIIEFNGEYFTKYIKNGNSSILVNSNSGAIRDGYIYNTVENGHVYIDGSGGIIAGRNNNSGLIENIYAVSDLYSDYYSEKYDAYTDGFGAGILAGDNAGTVKNAFVVGDRYQFTLDEGRPLDGGYDQHVEPSIAKGNAPMKSKVLPLNTSYENYFSNYAERKQLWNENFYDGINNKDSFDTKNYLKYGFYPHLKMDKTMNKYQPYIELPKITSSIPPKLVGSEVRKQTEEYAEVNLRFDNPSNAVISKINVGNLNCVIYEQQKVGNFYEVLVRLNEPKEYLSSYQITGFQYRSGPNEYTSLAGIDIAAEFYKPIKSFEDWIIMASDTSQNYRLKTDLDFSTVSNYQQTYINSLSGKLDGGIYDADGNITGMHKIYNIEPPSGLPLSSALFGTVNGTISNIKFENFSWQHDNTLGTALINTLYGTLDNLHVRDIDIAGSTYVSPILNMRYIKSNIANCTVKNATATNSKKIQNPTFTYIGGIISVDSGGSLNNCYVSDFNFTIDSPSPETIIGVGGIVGYGHPYGYVSDSYAIGNIKGTTNNGGIVGLNETHVDRCYSNVTIESNSEGNGGIHGTSKTAVENSLSLGNLLISKVDNANAHRISGGLSKARLSNYAFSNQTINNQNVGPDDSDGLLSKAELSNEDAYLYTIGLGTQFDYLNVISGETPKLKDTKGNLLPDQDGLAIASEDLSVNVISATQYGESYKVDLEINHPGYKVNSLSIDGMADLQITKSEGESVSTYQIISKKISAFDLYNFRVSLAENENEKKTTTLDTTINYGSPVFWEISSAEQWQAIMVDHANKNENFKIMGTLDFSTIQNPIFNLSVNRFVGKDKQTSIIKNVTFDTNKNYNLIRNVVAEVTDLTFDNFDMKYSGANLTNVGIIGTNLGNTKNCIFQNNKLSISGKNTYVGMIGTSKGNIENVEVSNIDIQGKDITSGGQVGGLVGAINGHMQNIVGKDINIDCDNMNYIGSIAGNVNVNYVNAGSTKDINIQNVNIHGNSYVGGIAGQTNNTPFFNTTGNHIEVTGDTTYAGGLFGYGYGSLNNREISGDSLTNVVVNGKDLVGGIYGYGGTVTFFKASNLNITGSGWYIGGAMGQGRPDQTEIRDSVIKGKYGVGGLVGYSTSVMYRNTLINSNVQGEMYVGGVTGTNYYHQELTESDLEELYQTNVYYREIGIYDCTITATKDYAGGISSIIDSKGTSVQNNVAVVRTKVTAQNYAGGYFGKIYGLITTNSDSSYIRDSTIRAANSYAGGYAGQVETKDTVTIMNNYIADTLIEADSYAGGFFGEIKKSNKGSGVAEIAKSLIFRTKIVCLDSDKADIIGKNYRDIIDIQKINGIKVEESTTLNGKVAKELLWEDTTKEHVEIIKEADLADWDLLTNISNPSTVSSNTKRPGLNWSSGRFSIYSTLGLNRDYGAATGTKNDFYFTPIDYRNHVFKLYADVDDGTYDILYSNKPKVEATFVDKVAIVTLPDVPVNNSYLTLKILTEDRTLSSTFRYGRNEYNTVKILQGETYYEGNDIGPQSVTIEDGTYVWYRSINYGYTSDNAEIVKGVSGNTIELTSRGYYFAVNTANGQISPLITFDTYGYLPSIKYASDYEIPYQEGMRVEGDYSTAYSLSDGYYQGETKLAYVPREVNKMSSKARKANIMNLPKLTTYASGVDRINLEFDSNMSAYETSGLEVNISTKDQNTTHTIKDRVVSIGYDFKTDMSITISNGSEREVYNIKAKDLIQSVSTYKDDYYYLVDDGVNSSKVHKNGEFIHVYQSKVLQQNQHILDLATGEKSQGAEVGSLLKTNALYTSGDMDTFYNLSISKQGEQTNTIEQQLFTKRGRMYGLDPSLKRIGNGIIVDDYDGKYFLTILQEDGKMLNIQDSFEVPKQFRNENIIEISNSLESDTSVVLIRYGDGDLIAFDYVSGVSIDVERKHEDVGFIDFMKASVLSMFDAPMQDLQSQENQISTFEQSLKTLELEDLKMLEQAELELFDEQILDEKAPVQEEIKGNMTKQEIAQNAEVRQKQNQSDSQPYVTIYNADKKQLETYEKEALLNQQHVFSENEKLEQAKKMGHKLTIATNEGNQTISLTSGFDGMLGITLGIFTLISSLLLILRHKRKILD